MNGYGIVSVVGFVLACFVGWALYLGYTGVEVPWSIKAILLFLSAYMIRCIKKRKRDKARPVDKR